MSKQGNLTFFTAAKLFAKFVASTNPASKSKGGSEKPKGHFVTIEGHVVFFPDGEIKDAAHAHDLAKRSGMSDHGAKALAKAHGEGRITTTSHLVETARKAKGLAKHGLKDTIAVKTALDSVKPKSERGSASVREMSPKDIEADPARFQYKVNVGATGTNSELKSVGKWNENLGGVILTWKDPADGKTYVINGHHRLELAQRLGVDKVAVRNISAPDAASARYVGAVANIAEGRGTAIDAGKLLRDSKVTPETLAEDGVSLKGKLASDGLALSKLPEALWNKAFKGELSVNRAAVIGGSGLGQSDQILLAQTAEKQEKGGKRLTDKEVGELAEQIKNAGTATVTTSSLFGEESMSQNLFVEKAQLSSYLKERLSKDRRLFGFVGKSDRADTLARAGNTINVSESQRIAEHASQMEDVFSHLAYRSGPVADALSRAAGRLAQGGSASEIKANLYEEVHQAVAQTLGKSVEAHSLPDATKEPEDKHTISMFTALSLFAKFAAEEPYANFRGSAKPTQKAIEAARRQSVNESDSFCPDCGAVYEWANAEETGEETGSCNRCGSHNEPVDGKLALGGEPMRGAGLAAKKSPERPAPRMGFADFSTADFTEGAFVTVPALLSRAGNYSDKGIHLTRADFDRAAASVSPSSPVKMNMAHLRRGSVLDGAGLGEIHRTWRRGDELWGEIAVPQWLASLARERGLKMPVSAEWDIKTKTLRGCAWERTPRIEDARAVL